jgi:hypothetical protein
VPSNFRALRMTDTTDLFLVVIIVLLVFRLRFSSGETHSPKVKCIGRDYGKRKTKNYLSFSQKPENPYFVLMIFFKKGTSSLLE